MKSNLAAHATAITSIMSFQLILQDEVEASHVLAGELVVQIFVFMPSPTYVIVAGLIMQFLKSKTK